MIDLIKREDAINALSKGEGCRGICSRAIRNIPAVTMVEQDNQQQLDFYYEAACRIVQAFDPEYPSPNVIELIQALSFASVKLNTMSTEKIVQWANKYCAEWFEKHIKWEVCMNETIQENIRHVST